MDRYICIHAHFYQPPRENPWLEAIELQDSAFPYHDWNERITSECYATNATSRILDENDRIAQIVNNYQKISFNFGPTLLAWVEAKTPDLYQAILTADQESQRNFSGHGSALAQAYNHMILPLANRRDKHTQVLWGIHDFERRFKRRPEGMWLPETAVDLETLDILAEQDILFTILAPRQASRIRPLIQEEWEDIRGERIDPTMPYLLKLPSGRTISLFFYDGPISRAVAFEKLLSRGETFARRLLGGFSDKREWPQIVHIATDGETYGHHHRFGDMALAYALNYIESKKLARLTNYAEYLEKHPPTCEVEIFENSSWSCVHGIERWRSNCGCNTGGHPGWQQAWRASLREGFDYLRDSLAPRFERKASEFLNDPWAARNDYIRLILDRSENTLDRFLTHHAARPLNESEKETVLKALELQRHLMLMYTSCGWFFDDSSGIETVQVMQYAGRAIQLAHELFGDSLEKAFLGLLEQAKSNIPQHGDGSRTYEKFVRPAMVDLQKVAAHYAISSVFHDYDERASIFCFTVDREFHQKTEIGYSVLALGRARIASEITRESACLCFGVLHFGGHNLNCGVRVFQGEKAFREMVAEVSSAFDRANFPDTLRMLDKHFGSSTYSLQSLFRDEQRRILDRILESALSEAAAVYRQLYRRNEPMMRFLKDSAIPIPRPLYSAADFVLNSSLRRAFEKEELDIDEVESLLKETDLTGVTLDAGALEYALRKNIERVAQMLLSNPSDLSIARRLESLLSLLTAVPFAINLWRVQNIFYEVVQTKYDEFQSEAKKGNETARELIEHFSALSEKLWTKLPKAPAPQPSSMKS